jgi:Helicase associated domain
MSEDRTMEGKDEVLAFWTQALLRRQNLNNIEEVYSERISSNGNAFVSLPSNGQAELDCVLAHERVVMPDVTSSSSFMKNLASPVEIAGGKELGENLTLEEIFRDHDLQASSKTLENSMIFLGDGSQSDLSIIFDDEDQEAPLEGSRSKRCVAYHSSASSVDSTDTCDTYDDGTQRFKPFHEEKWNTRLKELLQYRLDHGDCLVPHTYTPNPQLARWVKRQRRQYKLMMDNRSSTMSPERLSILNEIGFVWDSHDAAWKEKLNELKEFRHEHGHSLVPSNYRPNPQLATWVKCQRRQYKLYWIGKPSAMTPERILQLDQVGFEWELRTSGHLNSANPKSQQWAEAMS